MKKIEGFVNGIMAIRNPAEIVSVKLFCNEEFDDMLPAILLIAEEGEQLPEVMTKQEVMAMLRRVDKASNFPFSAAIVKALRAEGFDVETDTL